MSVILATDTYERVRNVIASFQRQTIASELELVLVAEATRELELQTEALAGFHSIRIVETESIASLGAARAAGVRASSAPFTFIAETHAYPDPEMAERLVEALSGPWAAAIPGFRNGNPVNALSWAAFLSDYGPWSQALPASDIRIFPSHDAAFRRSLLIEFGERLEHVLTFGDEFYLAMSSQGQRVRFVPGAGIEHVNLARFRYWVRERFLTGVLVAGYRSARWSRGKRLAYACGSPLIAIVLLARIRPGVRDAARRERLPSGTIPGIVLGVLLKAAGELRGYTAGASSSAEVAVSDFEIRKLALNSGEQS